jgi:hypothetical protein
MLVRALHLSFRILGWLLSPLVLTITATLGATLGFLAVASWAPGKGLIFALICGALGALAGCLAWMRLLRRSPRLREVLAVTPAGLPESEVVHEILQAVSLEERPPQ